MNAGSWGHGQKPFRDGLKAELTASGCFRPRRWSPAQPCVHIAALLLVLALLLPFHSHGLDMSSSVETGTDGATDIASLYSVISMDDEECGLDPLTCGATDPVSEPSYNMRQVIKQCILLEEHLVERAKFCRDCIIKHFLHIVGLLEEAEMMAPGGLVDDYPMLLEGDRLFQEQMDKWLQGEADFFLSPNDEARRKFRLSIAATIREYRKALVVVYYPPGGLGPKLPHFKLHADKRLTTSS